jgi:hypothetical protein
MQNGVDPERRMKTELAMAEGLTMLTKKTQSKRRNDEAEIDSLDSPICACATHMLMRFLHSHEVLTRSCGYFMRTREDIGAP